MCAALVVRRHRTIIAELTSERRSGSSGTAERPLELYRFPYAACWCSPRIRNFHDPKRNVLLNMRLARDLLQCGKREEHEPGDLHLVSGGQIENLQAD